MSPELTQVIYLVAAAALGYFANRLGLKIPGGGGGGEPRPQPGPEPQPSPQPNSPGLPELIKAILQPFLERLDRLLSTQESMAQELAIKNEIEKFIAKKEKDKSAPQ